MSSVKTETTASGSILQFDGKPNPDFHQWKEMFAVNMTSKHGPPALVYRTGETYIPELIPRPTAAQLLEDEDGFTRQHYLAECETRRREINDLKYINQRLYSDLLERISPNSMNRLRESPRWPEIYRTQCPRRLMAEITIIHTTCNTGNDIHDKYDSRLTYWTLRQADGETLQQFKTRFDRCIATQVVTGQLTYDDRDQAYDFLIHLSHKSTGRSSNDSDGTRACERRHLQKS